MKFILIILALLFISGCGEKKVKPVVNTSIKAGKIPSQESWDDTVMFTDSGQTKAILYAGHLSVFDSPPETILDDSIKIDFFNPAGEMTTVLTALRGKVDNVTKNLYAIDSVVAVSDSGVTLKTQQLMWRNKDQKIVTDKFVTITSPKEQIQGYGFESDQSLRYYTIYNIVYVTKLDTVKQNKANKK